MNNSKKPKKTDPICLSAINLLEGIGNEKPSQEQINIVSHLIVCVMQDYMNDALNYKQLLLPKSVKDSVNSFLNSLRHPNGNKQ